MKISLFKFSCRRGKIFHVSAFCLSCLRVIALKREGRYNENTADFRVVVITPRKAKVEVTTMTLFWVSPPGRQAQNGKHK
jgi:hypothetical protein